MSTSIFATVLASLGAFAGNLMDVQSRAAHHCGVALDPRQLPDSLRAINRRIRLPIADSGRPKVMDSGGTVRNLFACSTM